MLRQDIQTQSRARGPQPAQERYAAPGRRGSDSDGRPATSFRGDTPGQRTPLTDALGWFSLGLRLAQLVAPDAVARLIGVDDGADNCTTIRLIGVRELTSGLGIMTQPKPAGWVWARVGGDLMDLALLGRTLSAEDAQQDRVSKALLAVLGVTVLDVADSLRLSSDGAGAGRQEQSHDMYVRKAITVNRPRPEVYSFWRNFKNLPRFMQHLQSVQVTGDRTSHWQTSAPFGRSVEWDAEIVDDRPDELIAWRSLAGAAVDNSGAVRFNDAPGGRGTEVHVEMHYAPPMGAVGNVVAKLFGEAPDQQVYDDLMAFKQVMEVGEVVRSDATIHGHPHPAQPPAEPLRAGQTGAKAYQTGATL